MVNTFTRKNSFPSPQVEWTTHRTKTSTIFQDHDGERVAPTPMDRIVPSGRILFFTACLKLTNNNMLI